MNKIIKQQENDSNYDPSQGIKLQKMKSTPKIASNFNKKSWRRQQSQLYIQFLQSNRDLFDDRRQRKRSKIYKMMSKFIGRRNSNQCRSHHQKMTLKYGDIDQIIQNLSEDNKKWIQQKQDMQEQSFDKKECQTKNIIDDKIQKVQNDKKNEDQLQLGIEDNGWEQFQQMWMVAESDKCYQNLRFFDQY